jgi:hypothetical protein
MTKGSIFWMVDYIKANRESQTRYTIDLYLLRMGCEAGEIEAAWQIAGLNLNPEKPAFFKYLFPVTVICSLLSWFCLILPWQTAAGERTYPAAYLPNLTPTVVPADFHPANTSSLLFLVFTFWSLNNLMGIILKLSSHQKVRDFFSANLILNFWFIGISLAFDMILILEVSQKMAWLGPVCLTLVLLIGLLCTALEWRYSYRKIEVILSN